MISNQFEEYNSLPWVTVGPPQTVKFEEMGLQVLEVQNEQAGVNPTSADAGLSQPAAQHGAPAGLFVIPVQNTQGIRNSSIIPDKAEAQLSSKASLPNRPTT